MKTRIQNLDNVKWILTILMVLFHIQYYGAGGVQETVFLLIKNFGNCVVPAFALISGFLFWRNIERLEDLKNKYKNRIFTLLIPYLLWNLINTVLINVMDNGFDKLNSSILDINIYHDIILWQSSPHFWYIFMLMFWTVFSPILYFSYRYKPLFILLLISQGIYIVFQGENILHSRFIYIIYTWGGYIGYRRSNLISEILHWSRKIKVIVSASSGLLFISISIIACFFEFGMHIMVWICAIKAVSLILFTINLPLLYIGKQTDYKFSFWVFAVHYWLDVIFSKIVNDFCSDLLYQSVTFVCVLCTSLILGVIISKLFPKSFNLLTGGRSGL